jgi:hypothetical protein
MFLHHHYFSLISYRVIANEIAALRNEAQEWKRMRVAVRSPNAEAGKSVFEKVSMALPSHGGY